MSYKMELTNGTDTIVIKNEAPTSHGYYLQTTSYTPSINPRNTTGFGDTHLPVHDGFTISIVGANANDVHEKLATLVNLMDSVQLWADTDGTAADAVNYIYKPSGSTEPDDYRALVTGGARVEYSPYIEWVDKWHRMFDVRVSFMRGVWLGEEEAVTSKIDVQPSILHATFASDADVESPVDIDILFKYADTAPASYSVHIAPDAPILVEAESMSFGANIAVVADNRASGSNVLAITPASLTVASATELYISTTSSFPYKNFYIVGVVKNKSTSIGWSVNVSVRFSDGPRLNLTKYNKITIANKSIYPEIVNFGSFSFKESYGDKLSTYIRFEFLPDAIDMSGASDLEFDMFAIIPLANSGGVFNIELPSGQQTNIGSVGEVLSLPSGYAYGGIVTLKKVSAPYTGMCRQLTIGSDIYVVVFAVEAKTDGWRQNHTSAPPYGSDHSFTAIRRLSSLTPK